MTLLIICGGIQRISKFSQIVVPIMALLYIVLALAIVVMNIDRIPHVLDMIFTEAFTGSAALGGGMGMALMMGIKARLVQQRVRTGLGSLMSPLRHRSAIRSSRAYTIVCRIHRHYF